MAWVQLDDGFAQHPKTLAVGGNGVAMYVAGLCYCKRYGTPGMIPSRVVPGLFPHRSWRRTVTLLVEFKFWEPTASGFVVHDWDRWNKPQMSRSEAGRKAAEARWANAKRNATAHADRNASASKSHMPQDALSLSPPYVDTSSSQNRTIAHAHAREEDDEKTKKGSRDEELPRAVVEAIDVLAKRDLAVRQASPGAAPIGNPESWLNAARRRRVESDGARLIEAHIADPAADAASLAGPEPSAPQAPGARDPYADMRAAMAQRMADNAARIRANAHTPVDPDRVGRIVSIRDALGQRPPPPDPAEEF